MLIGYTNEMTDHELSELADWADYHAKDVPNPSWKRAYALIREGADLLLRRRAGSKQDPPVEEGGVCTESRTVQTRKIECQTCYDEEGSFSCIRVAHNPRKLTNSRGPM